jgi:hypothetical protein
MFPVATTAGLLAGKAVGRFRLIVFTIVATAVVLGWLLFLI